MAVVLALVLFTFKLKPIFVAHYVITPLGLKSRIKPRLKLLAFVIPYSGNHKVPHDTVFSLGPFNINKSQFRCP